MKMSRFLKVSFAACLAGILLTAVAEAQPGGGQRGGRGGQQRGGGQFGGGRGGGFGGGGGSQITKAMLLGSEEVLDELKVDEAQGQTIKAAVEAYRAERADARPDRSAFEGKSDEERRAMFEKMRKDGEELAKKTDEVLGALLEKDQVARLDQIILQIKMRGSVIAQLKSDEIKKKLSITDEQITKLEGVEEEANKKRSEMFAAMRGGGDGERPSREEITKKMEDARKATETSAMAVLTDDQKGKLKELTGKPFEVDLRAVIGGGRGGFGGGGGRGGDAGGGGRGRGRGEGGGEDGGRGRGRQRPQSDTDDAI